MLDDTTLYERVLGIEAPWFVAAVEPDEAEQSVTVFVALDKTISLSTPEGGNECAKENPRREESHFDAHQLKALDDGSKPNLTGMFGYSLKVSL